MRIPFAFFIALVITACERPGTDHGINDDVKARIALKSVFVEARLAAYDNREKLISASELIPILEEQGHLSALSSYGTSNLFFNPRIATWREPSLNAQSENEPAIILYRGKKDYVGITFRGQFLKSNQCPAQWSKGVTH